MLRLIEISWLTAAWHKSSRGSRILIRKISRIIGAPLMRGFAHKTEDNRA
jgi:hypothetical protein